MINAALLLLSAPAFAFDPNEECGIGKRTAAAINDYSLMALQSECRRRCRTSSCVVSRTTLSRPGRLRRSLP
jgi:hypothetical protein